jgi:hypothetical protein
LQQENLVKINLVIWLLDLLEFAMLLANIQLNVMLAQQRKPPSRMTLALAVVWNTVHVGYSGHSLHYLDALRNMSYTNWVRSGHGRLQLFFPTQHYCRSVSHVALLDCSEVQLLFRAFLLGVLLSSLPLGNSKPV